MSDQGTKKKDGAVGLTKAVLLLLPLVGFIFPGIFVVLLGPAGIKIVTILFPLLGGGG